MLRRNYRVMFQMSNNALLSATLMEILDVKNDDSGQPGRNENQQKTRQFNATIKADVDGLK